jgi:UDP-N-acetylmuramyl pentapeptide synthase
VETGAAAKDVHLEIGRRLAGVADMVILIKNSVSGWIEEGIKGKLPTTHYPLPTIIWFETAQQAHAALKDILKPGDVILFQNDWGDQYL